jgi:hypothetical protein
MNGHLSIDDFIVIDGKFENVREQIEPKIQEYNQIEINYDAINEFIESEIYDAFINGGGLTRNDTQFIRMVSRLLKEPIDLKVSIMENIFFIAGVRTSRPLGYDRILRLGIGLQSIYDAT